MPLMASINFAFCGNIQSSHHKTCNWQNLWCKQAEEADGNVTLWYNNNDGDYVTCFGCCSFAYKVIRFTFKVELKVQIKLKDNIVNPLMGSQAHATKNFSYLAQIVIVKFSEWVFNLRLRLDPVPLQKVPKWRQNAKFDCIDDFSIPH